MEYIQIRYLNKDIVGGGMRVRVSVVLIMGYTHIY